MEIINRTSDLHQVVKNTHVSIFKPCYINLKPITNCIETEHFGFVRNRVADALNVNYKRIARVYISHDVGGMYSLIEITSVDMLNHFHSSMQCPTALESPILIVHLLPENKKNEDGEQEPQRSAENLLDVERVENNENDIKMWWKEQLSLINLTFTGLPQIPPRMVGMLNNENNVDGL